MKQKIKKIFKKILTYLKDPKLFISFLLAWLITNGWAYIFLGLGIWLDIKWMKIVGTSYLAFLWMPFTPEKLVTIPISMFIYKLFTKKDKKGKTEKIDEENN